MNADDRAELDAVAAIARRAGKAPDGEVWAGDDAAVVESGSEPLLVTTDAMVEGVHFDRAYAPLSAIGWKALVCNLSDIAAMGGEPLAAVVAVSGASKSDLDGLYDGIFEAALHYHCPIVGGDLTDGSELVIAITVLGGSVAHPPLLRSGAEPGDHVFVTAPLGAAAAGLRALISDEKASGPHVEAHLRPIARVAEGLAAVAGGASSMIDVSDGFGLDLDRLATSSAVGIRLSTVPVAAGAEFEDALGGGEDYELVFTAPDWGRISGAFEAAKLPAPIRVGEVVADATIRLLAGEPLTAAGYRHGLSGRARSRKD